MKRLRGVFYTLAIVAAMSHGVPTWAEPLPQLRPSDVAIRLANKTDPIATDDLIQYSLVFSGVATSDLAHYAGRVEDLISDFMRVHEVGGDSALDAEKALVFLHEHVMRRYVEEQTRLDVLLDDGTYNCVSSAVLYMILVRAVGIPVVGVQTKDHAFCSVEINGRSVDVETTNSYGFDPGAKREFQDEFGQVTGFSYVPANRDPSRRETSQRGLLSLILQNHASLFTRRHAYSEAVAPSVDAHLLAQDKDSYEKLIISISNLASQLALQGEFEKGLALLDEALAGYGPEDRLSRLRGDVLYNWIVSSIDRGQVEAAETTARVRRHRGELGDREWRDVMVTIYQLQAKEIAGMSGYLSAMQHVQEGIRTIGRDSRLLRAESVYLHNYEVEVHNAMAVAFNEGRHGEAKAIVEDALQYLPDSGRLRSDLAAVQNALSGN